MKRHFLTTLFLIGFFSFAGAQNDNNLPRPDPAFNGKIDTRDHSKADWPLGPKAQAGAPNGKVVGSGQICGIGNNSDTFDIGYDRGSPVWAIHGSPFAFTGEVEKMRVELK